jgi:hypothetical protein
MKVTPDYEGFSMAPYYHRASLIMIMVCAILTVHAACMASLATEAKQSQSVLSPPAEYL